MSQAKLLIIIVNGGVGSVYSTVPTEVVIQDYDVEPGCGFADDSNPDRQTVTVVAKVVSPERLEELIHEDDNKPDDFFCNFYSCPRCGWEWNDESDGMNNGECGNCKLSDIEPYQSTELMVDGSEGRLISHVGDVNSFLTERRASFGR